MPDTQIPVLHVVIAGEKAPNLGRGYHESSNCRASSTGTKTQLSAANFKTKRDFWEGISQGQDHSRQLGSGTLRPNTVADEKPFLSPLDKEINGSQIHERLEDKDEWRATTPEIMLLTSEVKYSFSRYSKFEISTFEQENNTGPLLNRTGANTGKGMGRPNLFAKGLSVIDIRNILGELCGAEKNGITIKQGTDIGRRKTPAGSNSSSSRRLSDMKVGKIEGASGDDTEIIIREADCGLKHPKPLRLTETRRIISMCRGRVSGTPEMGRRAMSEAATG